MKRRILILLTITLLLLTGAVLAQDGEREVVTVDNINAMELLIRLGRGSAETAAWSADGEHIFVAGSLGIWKYSADALDTELEPELFNVGDAVDAMAVHPDGSTLAVKRSSDSLLEFYDTTTGELLSGVELENSPIFIEYSATGDQLVLSYGSRGIALVDNATETIISAPASLSTNSRAVVTPDGQKFIAASSSYDILIWDATVEAEPMELEGHTDRIQDLVISPDGTLLVSASNDDTFNVWDLASGELLQTFAQPEDDFSNLDVAALAFTPDGSTLITGHRNKVRFWDVAAREMSGEAEVGGSVTEIRVAPDGEQFIIRTSSNENAVQLFDMEGSLIATTFFHNGTIYASDFSPDSAILSFSDSDSFLYMWDTATVEEITFATKITDGVTTGISNLENIVYSSDGRYLATLQSFSADLRDPVTGELIHELDDLDGISEDLAFSPDDTMIAVVTSQGLYVFEVETGQRLVMFEDNTFNWLNDVTWSPDQTMLVTASRDNALWVYTIGQ